MAVGSTAIGIVIVLFWLAVTVLAPLMSPYDPLDMVGRRLQAPSWEHWLGTDALGRDVLSRTLARRPVFAADRRSGRDLLGGDRRDRWVRSPAYVGGLLGCVDHAAGRRHSVVSADAARHGGCGIARTGA